MKKNYVSAIVVFLLLVLVFLTVLLELDNANLKSKIDTLELKLNSVSLDQININKEKLVESDEKFTTIDLKISNNSQSLSSVLKKVSDNSNSVEKNGKNIKLNSNSISLTDDLVNENKLAIKSSLETLVLNRKLVEENKLSSKANKDSISSNSALIKKLIQEIASNNNNAPKTKGDAVKKKELDTKSVTTASGLKYEVLRAGNDNGKSPLATDKVEVHYKGMFLDGTVFDSSYKRGQSATFPLNAVIKGWTEGLQLMKEGAKWKFTIPPELAYGKRGAGASIPPNSTLVFEVELIKVR